MQTVQDLTTKEQQLEQQLQSVKNEKEQAAIAEREAKLTLLDALELKAKQFRLEALEATTADEKQQLYLFAASNQNGANALREELGLEVEIEVKDETELLNQTKKGIKNKILSLLITAVVFLAGFFISDFAGGKLDGGFFPYVLKYFASIFFLIATGFGRIWVVFSLLFYFLPNYISKDFAREFSELKPIHKMALIATMIIALLHFLNTLKPNAD